MKNIKKFTKIRFLDNCLLINNEILVFSDFHIGYEEYLFGKLIPIRVQLEEILKKLNAIFSLLEKENIKIKEIIILGDLKHEFGEISDSEWRETLQLLDYLLEKTNKIILIRGNHDNILGPIAKKREVELKDYYEVGEMCFMHGDNMFKECEDSKILILGHLHPSIAFYDNYKKEKFKCFLRGKWKIAGRNKSRNYLKVIIIPSFIPLVFGYDLHDINEERKDFFIINNKDLEKFEVIIYNDKEDKEYNFGRLKTLIKKTNSF